MSDITKRVYDRMNRAKYDRLDHVEITREEYRYFAQFLVDEPPPESWPQWAKDWRFEPAPGMDGEVFGFPCKIVDHLTSTQ